MTARLRLVASCDAREKWLTSTQEKCNRKVRRWKRHQRVWAALAAFGRWIAWPVTMWRRG